MSSDQEMILYAISYAHPAHGVRYLCRTTGPMIFPKWTHDSPKLYKTEGAAKQAIRYLPKEVREDCWVTKMRLTEYEEVGRE